jgi:hypothetical protein
VFWIEEISFGLEISVGHALVQVGLLTNLMGKHCVLA